MDDEWQSYKRRALRYAIYAAGSFLAAYLTQDKDLKVAASCIGAVSTGVLTLEYIAIRFGDHIERLDQRFLGGNERPSLENITKENADKELVAK